MKNQVLLLALVAALLFSATLSYAQPYGSGYRDPYASHRPQPGTIIGRGGYAVSNHSLSAQLLGLEYSFEGALGSNFTVIARAGLVPTGVSLTSTLEGLSGLHFSMAGGLTLEPRIYTNFERRARTGRSTYMNSADFVAFRTQCLWAGGEDLALVFTPLYGIRRTTGDHWAHEVTIGPRLAWIGDGDPSLSPHLQYRLVFMF